MNPTQGTATYLQIEFLERKNAELEQQLAEQAAQLEAEKIRSAAILESIDGCAGRVAELRQQLAELREAAGELVANAEWDGDISTVDTGDLKALRAELLQETTT